LRFARKPGSNTVSPSTTRTRSQARKPPARTALMLSDLEIGAAWSRTTTAGPASACQRSRCAASPGAGAAYTLAKPRSASVRLTTSRVRSVPPLTLTASSSNGSDWSSSDPSAAAAPASSSNMGDTTPTRSGPRTGTVLSGTKLNRALASTVGMASRPGTSANCFTVLAPPGFSQGGDDSPTFESTRLARAPREGNAPPGAPPEGASSRNHERFPANLCVPCVLRHTFSARVRRFGGADDPAHQRQDRLPRDRGRRPHHSGQRSEERTGGAGGRPGGLPHRRGDPDDPRPARAPRRAARPRHQPTLRAARHRLQLPREPD